jgi:hypothetical protein
MPKGAESIMGKITAYNSRQIKKELERLEMLQKELNERTKTDVKVMRKDIEDFAQEVGAPLALERDYSLSVNWLNATLSNIRIVLQSKMMFNACESAKWSCWFAAAAASLSLLATAVALATFLPN